jgi:hypothetical protein
MEDTMLIDFVFFFSLILAGLALVSVFVDITLVSQYAFWVVIAAYVLLASHRQRIIWRISGSG